MPPPCHSANTPGACGAADTSGCVNGRLLLVMDMAPPPTVRFYAGTSGVDARGTYMSNDLDTAERRFAFSGLTAPLNGHTGCRFQAWKRTRESRGSHALEAKRCNVQSARADHRGCRERPHAAVRVRRWAPAPRARR